MAAPSVSEAAQALLGSRRNANAVVPLLKALRTPLSHSQAQDADPDAWITACAALLSFFRTALATHDVRPPFALSGAVSKEPQEKAGQASGENGAGGAGGAREPGSEAEYRRWLRGRYEAYRAILVECLRSDSAAPALKSVCVEYLLELARVEKPGCLNTKLLRCLVTALIQAGHLPPQVLARLLSFSGYSDLSSVLLHTLRQHCVSSPSTHAAHLPGSSQAVWDNVVALLIGLTRSLADPVQASLSKPLRPAGARPSSTAHSASPSPVFRLWVTPNEDPTLHSQPNSETATFPKKRKRVAPQPNLQARGGEEEEEEPEQRHRVRDIRRGLAACWLSLLRCSLPRPALRKALVCVHEAMPLMPNPLLLSDLLSRAYTKGSALAVFALRALFELMLKHGLEYPEYYPRLLRLLDPSIFLLKHRAHFFKLLDASLASPLLPSYITAAFAKRLGRLALHCPAPGAVLITALLHNLLRRHPSINTLLHNPAPPPTTHSPPDSDSEDETVSGSKREHVGSTVPSVHVSSTVASRAGANGSSMNELTENGTNEAERAAAPPESAKGEERGSSGLAGVGPGEGKKGSSRGMPPCTPPHPGPGADPFDAFQFDLSRCCALKSSLWEVEVLRTHFSPTVARFAASLEADLTQRSATADLELGDFGATSTASMLQDELGRRVKAVPLAFYPTTPSSLFPSSPAAVSSNSFQGWHF